MRRWAFCAQKLNESSDGRPLKRRPFRYPEAGMDVTVTFEDEPAGCRGLELLELRGLFEDWPTIPLVEALCDRACKKGSMAPVNNIGQLIDSMYDVPKGRDAIAWLEEELGPEHVQMLRHGVTVWRLGR